MRCKAQKSGNPSRYSSSFFSLERKVRVLQFFARWKNAVTLSDGPFSAFLLAHYRKRTRRKDKKETESCKRTFPCFFPGLLRTRVRKQEEVRKSLFFFFTRTVQIFATCVRFFFSSKGEHWIVPCFHTKSDTRRALFSLPGHNFLSPQRARLSFLKGMQMPPYFSSMH